MEGKQKRGWQFLQPPTKREARWKWTGFGGKTLWDWMQLLSALAIPTVIAIGTLWFTAQQNATQRYIENQRAQDAALQAYFDQMGQLLLDKDRPLRLSDEGSEERMLARARTLAVLSRLDPYRKRSVLRFLHDSGLINRQTEGDTAEDYTDPIISLEAADLRMADLSESNLVGIPPGKGVPPGEAKLPSPEPPTFQTGPQPSTRVEGLPGADLSGVNLSNADLSGTYLLNADLSRADLSNADLTDANLTGADLTDADLTGVEGISQDDLEAQAHSLQGVTMPDGTRSVTEEVRGTEPAEEVEVPSRHAADKPVGP